jgi:Flp pilus assembly protein TadB
MREQKHNDIKRCGPCSRFDKTTEKDRGQEPQKPGDHTEHPAVHVARMICKLILTLVKYYLIFLFFMAIVFIIIIIIISRH